MIDFQAMLTAGRPFWQDAVDIWLDGGWAMIGIAIVALVLYGTATHLYLRLWATGFRFFPEQRWRRWMEEPALRRGPIGSLLDFVDGATTIPETVKCFEHLRTRELVAFERDLRIVRVCVGAAPLLGLLGTVTGMLTTFGALSSGSGGEKTMQLVASGISEALITTETGLVIALPGLLFQYQLSRILERYKAFLAHLETACVQAAHWRNSRRRAA